MGRLEPVRSNPFGALPPSLLLPLKGNETDPDLIDSFEWSEQSRRFRSAEWYEQNQEQSK